jgi:hypothetical protein
VVLGLPTKYRNRYFATHHLLNFSLSLDVESVQILSMFLVRNEPSLSFQLVFDIMIPFAVGYFDYPRRTGTENLAKKLDISMSTLSEVLRAAQRRIFAEYFRAAYSVSNNAGTDRSRPPGHLRI